MRLGSCGSGGEKKPSAPLRTALTTHLKQPNRLIFFVHFYSFSYVASVDQHDVINICCIIGIQLLTSEKRELRYVSAQVVKNFHLNCIGCN